MRYCVNSEKAREMWRISEWAFMEDSSTPVFLPLRNEPGEYLGCLEITQDITDIHEIRGEKRLPS
jgi:DUF438 domain-containing protein